MQDKVYDIRQPSGARFGERAVTDVVRMCRDVLRGREPLWRDVGR
jgi:hypothetical protein